MILSLFLLPPIQSLPGTSIQELLKQKLASQLSISVTPEYHLPCVRQAASNMGVLGWAAEDSVDSPRGRDPIINEHTLPVLQVNPVFLVNTVTHRSSPAVLEHHPKHLASYKKLLLPSLEHYLLFLHLHSSYFLLSYGHSAFQNLQFLFLQS